MMVFGFLLLMAIFVTQFLVIVTRNARYQAQSEAAIPLRPIAMSALELSIAVMNEFREFDDGLRMPSQGWDQPLDWANFTWPGPAEAQPDIEIELIDESGKFPLGTANGDQMEDFLEMFGLDRFVIQELVDSLDDWTDDDGDLHKAEGGEAKWYERNSDKYPRLPPNRPLQSLEELRFVKGWGEVFFDEDGRPNYLFQELRTHASLKHRGGINVNTASPFLLEMLLESDFIAEDVLQRIAGPDGMMETSDDVPLSPGDISGVLPDGVQVAYEVSLVRAKITVKRGLQQYFLEALIQVGGAVSGTPSVDEDDDPEQGTAERNRVNTAVGRASGGGITVIELRENQTLN